MVEFFIGVAVGAAFAPFWMMVWNWLRNLPYVKPVVDSIVGMFSSK